MSSFDGRIPSIEGASNTELLQRIDALLLETKSDPKEVLKAINQAHAKDLEWARKSLLPLENTARSGIMITNPITYEDIRVQDRRISTSHNLHEKHIAIRTKERTPLLNQDEIQLLKHAADLYWNEQSDKSSSSRFTYQRKGNSEAHLSDIVSFSRESCINNDVPTLVDDILLHRVYPWIREAFLTNEKDINPENTSLYIYDSIFIRYNATEANDISFAEMAGEGKKPGGIGAGQPLHRDLGYVSVNIMLNDPSEFEGGGTFFENQLLSSSTLWDNTQFNLEQFAGGPLRPLGAGHALAHFSSDRHAGAATIQGVRDILVIFIAAAEMVQKDTITSSGAPKWEQSARLKTTARSFCQQCFGSEEVNNMQDELLCRIQHLRLATDAAPTDGEAWHYLGMALIEYTDIENQILDLAITCFEEALKHTPCDARLYNNLGLAWEKRLAELLQSNNVHNHSDLRYIHDNIKSSYEKAVVINSICSTVGCDVVPDLERVCLNFGLYLSYQDDYRGAVQVLERIQFGSDLGDMPLARRRVIEDAHKLMSFCENRARHAT